MPKFNLRVKSNLKRATSKAEIKQDMSAVFSVIPWILPSTLLGLNGWAGLGVSFASTWGLGAVLNIPSMRRSAWSLAAAQVAYALGSGAIQDVTGRPVWRFSEPETALPPAPVTPSEQGPNVNGLMGAMQAGASMARLPDGQYAPSYDGVNGWEDNYQGVNGYETQYQNNDPTFGSASQPW